MKTTSNYGLKKPEGTDVVNIDDFNSNADIIDGKLKEYSNSLNDLLYPTAGGTGTAITLTLPTLVDGYAKTFIASANNSGSATTINGKPLYKPGTTTAPTLISGKAYSIWYNSTSSCFFIKASAEGSAVVSNVLAGITFSNDTDTGLTGTMVNNGAVTITPGSTAKTIPVGYHNGSGTVATDSNLVTGNIRSGVSIFGVAGKSSVVDTADGTTTAGQMLSGASGYVNGSKITGTIGSKGATTYNPSTTTQTIASGQYLSGVQTIAPVTGTANIAQVLSGYTFSSANGIGLTGNIPSLGATTYTPGTSNQTVTAGQYLSGVQTILGDPDLIASNIISGTSIFGVNGSANISSLGGGLKFANGTVASLDYNGSSTISLDFIPLAVYMEYTQYNGTSGYAIIGYFIQTQDGVIKTNRSGWNLYANFSVSQGKSFSITTTNTSGHTFYTINWYAVGSNN